METGIDYTIARRRMVTEQLQAHGITDRKLLHAFLTVPRHIFVDPAIGSRAYDDCSFPIGHAQTISQPYTIAFMIQSLDVRSGDRVLEIGTGSGYQTAILSLIARDVYSIERLGSLAEKAESALSRIHTGRIRIKIGDGAAGWRHYAPYDRIIVSAAMSGRPKALLDQLADDGLLIAPIATESEHLMLFSRDGYRVTQQRLKKCAFVPLRKGVSP
ncbi:MAG: protein-L-isoaspartate(D-aspartate) O-methyltransferase [bacterium]|nr:MAG: protein-L-isoaspartate(D-aspartate) O-methyltransferase [bacterium]